jgi:N6-L-threonylcarbamoyladenine synthase
LFDKVKYNGIKCFIYGRRSTGYFDIRKVDGTVIHRSAKSKDLILVSKTKTLLWERRENSAFLSPLNRASAS